MKVSRSNTTLFRISLAVVVSGILILATVPLSHPVVPGINDKTNHMAAFFVLSLLTDFSFPGKRFHIFVFLPLMGYGLAIEGIQYFIPYRMFSMIDVAADALGIGLYRIAAPLIKKTFIRFYTENNP